jgi:hypothetical protein
LTSHHPWAEQTIINWPIFRYYKKHWTWVGNENEGVPLNQKERFEALSKCLTNRLDPIYLKNPLSDSDMDGIAEFAIFCSFNDIQEWVDSRLNAFLEYLTIENIPKLLIDDSSWQTKLDPNIFIAENAFEITTNNERRLTNFDPRTTNVVMVGIK